MAPKLFLDQNRMIYALSKLGWTTREIQGFLGKLSLPSSERTIKKRSGVEDNVLQVGRAKDSTVLPAHAVPALLRLLHLHPDVFDGNILHLFDTVQKLFNFTPQQLLNWTGLNVNRGGMTFRRCLRCREYFPSMSSGDRIGPCCEQDHRSALKEARMSIDNPDAM